MASFRLLGGKSGSADRLRVWPQRNHGKWFREASKIFVNTAPRMREAAS